MSVQRLVLSAPVPDPRAAPPLRWGLIGTGWPARELGRAVRASTAGAVVAVGSRDLERAQALAHELGARAHHGYEALVGDPEIEAVHVATPHSLHREHALLAIEAGKHVLVEKPFTRNATEAREVLAAAKSGGVFVMEAMWTRFLPHMVLVRELVRQGAVGEVVAIHADHGQRVDFDPTHRMYAPSLAGGALLDLGVYPIAFAHDVLGAPSRVQASSRLAPTGVDRSTAVILDHEGGGTAVLYATSCSRTPTSATVVGTEGRLEIGGDFYKPNQVVLTKGGTSVRSALTLPSSGFEYQVAEVARQVAAGASQSETMPWRASVEIVSVMDEVRRLVGVRYPGERLEVASGLP